MKHPFVGRQQKDPQNPTASDTGAGTGDANGKEHGERTNLVQYRVMFGTEQPKEK